ncbi:MAG: MBOAT family protein [Kiritimatiellae bacterium]|nr:MBOAT family protein [Kiritimatiellia bacterium]MCO6401220.1 MBOAT family protein [Verrucomicrobiota bacterium]
MLFNSIHFLLFFPLVFALFFALPHVWRWVLLLAASLYFYMCWKPIYIVLLLVCSYCNHVAAVNISRSSSVSRRRGWLVFALIVSFGLLFSFKYLNFASNVALGAIHLFGLPFEWSALHILLPVGISFYTFQAVSYTIDVYRGETKVELSFPRFLLFVTFFPQLVAGPIERSGALLPQFYERMEFDYQRAVEGLQLMAWGMFKKVVVADTLSSYVEIVYRDPLSFSGGASLLATYLFAFQIYADFSGYSDIARGAARILGFRLMVNFRQPYQSRSIPEFWQRWHISLSTWFRDYVYIPLGGNRVRPRAWIRNVLVVFVVSGFWHGANYTFLIWGALHGLYFMISRLASSWRRRIVEAVGLVRVPALHRTLQMAITFHLVCFAWIFFRADSLTKALDVIRRVATDFNLFHPQIALQGFDRFDVLTCLGVVAAMEGGHWARRRWDLASWLRSWPTALRWMLYLVGALVIYWFWKSEGAQFIYFQF